MRSGFVMEPERLFARASAGALFMSAVSQLVRRAQIFFREPDPTLPVSRRPQIAGNASSQTLAAIVDLDELLSQL